MRALLIVSLVLGTGCFNFADDLQSCVDAGRCSTDGAVTLPDAGTDAGSLPPLGGNCDVSGMCWEAPLPSSLELTGVTSTGPDDWWFSTTAGAVFHRSQGRWSMQMVGQVPSHTNDLWSRVPGLLSCGDTPWATVLASDGTWNEWRLDADGGETAGPRLTDGAGSTALVNAWWSEDGGCAVGGKVSLNLNRSWFAESSGASSPLTAWDLPEQMPGDEVTALGGASLGQLWLAVSSGSTRSGIYRRVGPGFERRYPLPATLTSVTGLCELSDGTLIAGGPDGLSTVDANGGTALFNAAVVGVVCQGQRIIAAAAPGLVDCMTKDSCGLVPALASKSFSAIARRGSIVAVTRSGEVVPVDAEPWSSGTFHTLLDVWVGGDGRGFAVGDQFLLAREPSGGWSTRLDAPGLTNARVVRGLADGGLMVFGNALATWVASNGALTNIRVVHADGGLNTDSVPLDINTAEQAPNGTWWVVGTAPADQFLALHLVGDTLVEVPFDAGVDPVEMHSLAFAPTGEGWAGGRGGKVWHYQPLTGWSLQWTADHGETFTAALASGGRVYFGGGGGKMAVQLDGGWTTVQLPDTQDEIHLLYESPAGIRAIGRRHRYTQNAQGAWGLDAPLPVDPERLLYRGVVAGERGWIVGEQGTVVSFPR